MTGFQFTTFQRSDTRRPGTHPAVGLGMHFQLPRQCKNKSGPQEGSLTIAF